MNVLLTGATGFLGSRVATLLKNTLGSKDRIVLLTSAQVDNYICINHKNYSYDMADFVRADIEHIDIIIHVGWFCAKCNDDIMDIEKNFSPVVNTNYLLSHLPNIPSKIIFCSSCGVYGGTGTFDVYKKGDIIDENTGVNLVNQYAISKYVTELLVREWALKHSVMCHILRPGPLYGVGDRRKDYLMGRMLYNAAVGDDLSIYAEPSMRRNYLYVDDCARFIINSMELKEDVGPINLVSVNNLSIVEIAEMICKTTKGKVNYSINIPNTVFGKELIYSAEKCNKYLGKEEFTFEQGLKLAYDWNISYYTKDKK